MLIALAPAGLSSTPVNWTPPLVASSTGASVTCKDNCPVPPADEPPPPQAASSVATPRASTDREKRVCMMGTPSQTSTSCAETSAGRTTALIYDAAPFRPSADASRCSAARQAGCRPLQLGTKSRGIHHTERLDLLPTCNMSYPRRHHPRHS